MPKLDQDALAGELARGDHPAAVLRVDAAAAIGDPDALFQNAVWRLIGDLLPRDLPRARAELRRAAGDGHADAAAMEIALTANGTGGPRDWARARTLLDAAASLRPDLRSQRALVAAMRVGAEGAPFRVPSSRTLVADGSIRLFPAFANAQECAHLATSLSGLLAPAMVLDPASGRMTPHPIRTAHEAAYGPTREDLAVRAINLRIAAASGSAVEQGEALTILRYAPGQKFGLHSDVIARARNQRIATMLIYLNDAFEGGETIFPEHDLVVRPKAGDALLFLNTLSDDRPDPRKRHAGEPVRRGIKWLATRWIRARAFDVWSGPESA